MRRRVVFLTRLREGADPEAYHRFLREVDYPQTKKLLPVSEYKAMRIEGRVVSEGEAGYDYLEVLDIEDFDAYKEAFANPSPEVAELIKEVFSFIDDKTFLDVRGTVIE